MDHSQRLADEAQGPPCRSSNGSARRSRVVGQIGKESIGSFSHKKLLKEGQVVVCEVHVFPLEVTRQRKTWPEKGKREVQWFSRAEAARTVQEPVLGKMIRDLHKNEK